VEALTSCKYCSAGFYTNQPGMFQCTPCPVRSELHACSDVSQLVLPLITVLFLALPLSDRSVQRALEQHAVSELRAGSVPAVPQRFDLSVVPARPRQRWCRHQCLFAVLCRYVLLCARAHSSLTTLSSRFCSGYYANTTGCTFFILAFGCHRTLFLCWGCSLALV
jgi:hypothetical protein